MAIEAPKLNLFGQAPALESIASVNAPGKSATAQGSASKHPFRGNSQYTGLASNNPSINAMSYRLPNGNMTSCNTIGIA